MGWWDFVLGPKPDATAEQQRQKLAAARETEAQSRQRWEAEMRDLEGKHFGGAITDIDVEVSRARSRLAEESTAQDSKAQDVGNDQRQKKNQELKKRFANTGGHTDHNIMDEEAGKARVRLAKESKARREWEAAQEKRMNRQFRKTLQNEEAVVDDDIM